MEGAKCFIEVYKCGESGILNSDIADIKDLKIYLEVTQMYKWQTIAVWYFKPKVST